MHGGRSIIRPVEVAGSATDVPTQRPLDIMGKISERIIHNRMLLFMELVSGALKRQYEFRRAYSTNDAMITVLDLTR